MASLKGLGGFRGAASVRSWLYRIAIHCALSWLRDHKREQPSEIDEAALVPAHERVERGAVAGPESFRAVPIGIDRLAQGLQERG